MENAEIMDIVDLNDKVIGRATRDMIYKKKLCHRIVHVLVFTSQGKMVLQKRSDSVSWCPNHWSTSVGGHVQADESYEQAALREYQEELGTTSEIQFLSKDFYEIPGRPSKFIVAFKTTFDGPFNPDPEAVSEVRAFTIAELKQMLSAGEKFHPELQFLLEKYYF